MLLVILIFNIDWIIHTFFTRSQHRFLKVSGNNLCIIRETRNLGKLKFCGSTFQKWPFFFQMRQLYIRKLHTHFCVYYDFITPLIHNEMQSQNQNIHMLLDKNFFLFYEDNLISVLNLVLIIFLHVSSQNTITKAMPCMSTTSIEFMKLLNLPNEKPKLFCVALHTMNMLVWSHACHISPLHVRVRIF